MGPGRAKIARFFGPGGGRLHGGTLGKRVIYMGEAAWRLILSPLGSCFCFTLGGSNTRKTRVWELPGARKHVKISPGTFVKYEVPAEEATFLLELAALWGSKM